MSATTVSILPANAGVLGNIRPQADQIRSSGKDTYFRITADVATNLQDQIDKLYGSIGQFSVTIPDVNPSGSLVPSQVTSLAVSVLYEDSGGLPSGRFQVDLIPPNEAIFDHATIERIQTNSSFVPLSGASWEAVFDVSEPTGWTAGSTITTVEGTRWPRPAATEYFTFRSRSVSTDGAVNVASPPTANVTVNSTAGLDLGLANPLGLDPTLAIAIGLLGIAAGGVNTTQLAALAVTAAKIANGGVGTTQLAATAVTTAKIANLAVDNAQLAALAVDSAKLANSAVTSTKIANLAVGTAAIAALAVGTAQIANAAITSAQIANLAVGTAAIASLAVGTAQIANAAITDAKVNDLSAGKINTGTLNAALVTISGSSSGYTTTIIGHVFQQTNGTIFIQMQSGLVTFLNTGFSATVGWLGGNWSSSGSQAVINISSGPVVYCTDGAGTIQVRMRVVGGTTGAVEFDNGANNALRCTSNGKKVVANFSQFSGGSRSISSGLSSVDAAVAMIVNGGGTTETLAYSSSGGTVTFVSSSGGSSSFFAYFIFGSI